jgi:hypothetical protein
MEMDDDDLDGAAKALYRPKTCGLWQRDWMSEDDETGTPEQLSQDVVPREASLLTTQVATSVSGEARAVWL